MSGSNRTVLIALLMMVMATAAAAQLTAPRGGSDKVEHRGLAAGGANLITTASVEVVGVVLINRSATVEKTVSIYDRSTDCGAGPCNLTPPDLAIAPKTIYTISLPFVKAKGGIVLVAPDGVSIEYKLVVVP